MLKLTFKNLRANKVRFALTTFGVVLAVSFVVSAFVLGDGLRSTFTSLSDEIVADTDVAVRPLDEFGAPTALTAEDLAVVKATNGVAEAVASTEAPENSVRPINADGDEIPTNGPPQLAFSWSDNEALSPFTLVEGDSPEVGQFVMDLDGATTHGFDVGETYTVITPSGRQELTLSGLSRFGTDNQTLGAVLMGMSADQVDELFGTTGYDEIAISVDDGVDPDQVIASLRGSLVDYEVVDQATVARDQSAEFNQGIDIVQNILLGFAGVSLFVSIFIIYNTFAIVLSQRTREMGLLRAIGADSRQLRRSAMGEALVIGGLASVLGIVGGLLVAAGLTALFGLIGADLPDYPTIVSTRTVLAATLVGIGVTVVAAFGPTRKAARVAPIAAIRDGGEAGAPRSRTRLLAGGVFVTAGVILGGLGLAGTGSTSGTVSLMAIGAIGVFLGVTFASPLLVGPVVTVVGWPLRRLGVAGKLAGQNARRNSRRTATTAAALMIGLAVVSMALVVGESVKAQFRQTLQSSVAAEYLVVDQTSDAGFPTTVVDDIAADPAFGDVTGFKYADVSVNGSIDEAVAADLGTMPALFDIDVTAGDYADDGASLLVSRSRADDWDLTVGDRITVAFTTGVSADLTISGIYDDEFLIEEPWLLDQRTFADAGLNVADNWLAFSSVDGADPVAVDTALSTLSATYPQADVQTAGEFQETLEGLIDQILTVLNALVALAVVIALIGIANTLALSIHERTRELGLVRAVGMSRRQVRRMVRYEAALIAFFGAVLGIAIGIAFGSATVTALPDNFTSTLAIPSGQIAVLLITAAFAGLTAAWLPARRAGRMNILEAIATN
jgi:putative ABC transport system permease protein